MNFLQHPPAISMARDAIAARTALVVAAPANGNGVRPFVEHPALPLCDADRDAFLALLEDESEPNQALISGAERFKSLGL